MCEFNAFDGVFVEIRRLTLGDLAPGTDTKRKGNRSERLTTLRQMFCYCERKFFPLQEYISTKIFPANRTRYLFDLQNSQTGQRVRAQAIFSLRGLEQDHAEYLMQHWRERPEFKYFRAYIFSLAEKIQDTQKSPVNLDDKNQDIIALSQKFKLWVSYIFTTLYGSTIAIEKSFNWP